MDDVRYFMITPSGRRKLKARSDVEAAAEFETLMVRFRSIGKKRWVASDPQFRLVKETRETLMSTGL